MKGRVGATIKYDRYYEGWYYTDPNYFLPAIMLTKEEVLAFFLGQELFKRYLGTAFEQPLRITLDRMKQYYDMQAEISTFSFTGGATLEVKPELLAELHQANVQKYQIEIMYYSANSDELSRRIVDPYHLHNVRGDWYLVAFCHRRREIRDFLVGRIRECEVLYSTFQVTEG